MILCRINGAVQPIAITARYIENEHNTNNAAEYQALLDGLDLAAAHCASHIHVLGDSELVVNQTKGHAKVNSRLRGLALQVQQKLSQFQSFTIRNVKREHNQAADFLSKLLKKGDAPLINHPVEGWTGATSLRHYLHEEGKYPS